MDIDSKNVNVSYFFVERTVSRSVPIHQDCHQSVMGSILKIYSHTDINMELGTVKIRYDGPNEGEVILTVIQPAGVNYLTQRIQGNNCIIHNTSLRSTLEIHLLCRSPCEITIPFRTHPVLYSELPTNDRLGIILPPTQFFWIQSQQLMYTNRNISKTP